MSNTEKVIELSRQYAVLALSEGRLDEAENAMIKLAHLGKTAVEFMDGVELDEIDQIFVRFVFGREEFRLGVGVEA